MATIKALKLHGGIVEKDLETEDVEAVKRGLSNLLHHIEVLKDVYKLPVVVAINKYESDTQAEVDFVINAIKQVKCVAIDAYSEGADGCKELAKEVVDICDYYAGQVEYAYNLDSSVETKIRNIITKVYGGDKITFSIKAMESLQNVKKLKLEHLPVIMAKTQFSLSADKKLINKPEEFEIFVQDIEIRRGAGFLVVVCGNMLLMPALGVEPAAINMKIDKNYKIEGLF